MAMRARLFGTNSPWLSAAHSQSVYFVFLSVFTLSLVQVSSIVEDCVTKINNKNAFPLS